jgi:CBS domain-containing protein
MLRVKDVMQSTSEVVHVDQSLHEAGLRMRDAGLPFLPVVDADEIVGVLSLEELAGEALDPESDLGKAKVREHLSTELAFCREDDELKAARALMQNTDHERLVVTDQERQLSGILTLASTIAALQQEDGNDAPRQRVNPAERLVDTPGRAKGDPDRQPEAYSAKPKIKKDKD